MEYLGRRVAILLRSGREGESGSRAGARVEITQEPHTRRREALCLRQESYPMRVEEQAEIVPWPGGMAEGPVRRCGIRATEVSLPIRGEVLT